MRPYNEAVKPKASAKQWADVRRRMNPPHRQSVAEISQELGIHVITLYKWRKFWRLQGRADSKCQIGSGLGCRIAIASSAVMSCITACMPARID
jgi:transposase-like protein